MGNFSLNNTVPEPDRSMDELGYNGLALSNPEKITPQQTSYKTTTTSRGDGYPEQPSPMDNEVQVSADTQKSTFPTPCGDFARRTY